MRAVAVGALAALSLAIGSGIRTQSPASTVSVQLLAINDFHGNLEPPSGANGLINATPAGGAAYLAAHLARDAAQNPNSIIVSAGDVVGASPLVSSLSHDEATIEAMNAMHLAISSVGNHEFDHGVPELLRLQRGGCHPVDGCSGDRFSGARFEYLSANVVDKATGAPLLPATAVRTIGGITIGFIGETLRGTPAIVSPAATKGLGFLDEAETANAYAARLKQQGVQVMVLLVHQGGRQQASGRDLDPNGCVNFNGTAIESIVDKLSADIQVVVSGHSHQFYNCRFGERLVTSAGSFGRMITRIDLSIDRASGRLVRANANNEVVTRDVPADPAVSRIVAKYAKNAETKAAVVVGTVTAEIPRRQNDAGESPLGDVVADTILEAARAPENGGAVVAFMNSGGIRADIVARAAQPGVAAGTVRYRDLFAVQPFGNVVAVVTMTGEAIRRVLEQQFEAARPNMLQVSRGFTYRYRSSAPAGQHVERESIVINGRRIAAGDRVRVASLDFLLDGAGGFPLFREGTDRIVVVADIDAMVAYFKAHSPVAPGAADRIVKID
jgi:5'-nucleotidase